MAWTLLFSASAHGQVAAASAPGPEREGIVKVPAFELPISSLLSGPDRDLLARSRAADELDAALGSCPVSGEPRASELRQLAACQAEAVYRTNQYRRLREKYPVTVRNESVNGIPVEIFEPRDGVSAKNAHRILIDLHGGGFRIGARWAGHFESAPVSSLAKIRVVSVDYRQGPDHVFPAATEDAVAVYTKLLETYRPEAIGIYGCSAGGLLTAQVVAALARANVPLPGAAGILCAGAAYWADGESRDLVQAMTGRKLDDSAANPYFRNVDRRDPQAFPAFAPDVLAKFPPSLLISSTRDFALSSVVHTHSTLISQGVKADLHVWEGQEHAFFYKPDLPQSDEAFKVIVNFFDRNLR